MIRALRHVWRNPWARLFLTTALAVVAYLLFRRTAAIWLSLGIAYTIAYLTHPITRLAASRGLPKWVGGLVTVLALLLLLGVVSVILQQVIAQLITLVNELPRVLDVLQSIPERLQAVVPPRFQEVFGEAIGVLREPLESLSTDMATWLRERSGMILGEIPSVVIQIFRTVVVPVMTLYLIFDFERVNASLRRAVPPRHRAGFDDFVHRLDVAAGAYVKAQLLLATMVGFMVWLGLTLFGMPMSLALGFLAGVGNLIPFFGPVLAGVPAVFVALGQGVGYAALVALFLIAVQQLDGNVLTPLIFSRTTRLHPLTVIVAILLGFTFLGILGAILAVPVTAFFTKLYRDRYFDSAWYRGANGGPDG